MKINICSLLTLTLLTSCAGVKEFGKKFDSPKLKNDHFTLKWAKNLDPDHESGNLPIGFGSPLIVEDLLFMGSLDGHMRSYDLTTGRLLWDENEEQPLASKPTFSGAHIIYGSRLGRLYSRNYITGKLNYAIDLGSPIESEPTVHEGRMFVHLRNHELIAMDAQTGKIFWTYKRSVPYASTLQRSSRPLIYKNKIYVGFADGHVGSLSVEEGLVIWEKKITSKHKFVDVDVDPIIFNSKLVVGSANGPLTFLDPTTGLVTRTVDVVIGHSPVIHESHLIVGTIFGQIVRIDREGGIVQRKKVADESISSLAIWKGMIAVSTMGQKLFLVDMEEFNKHDHYQLGSDQSSVFGYLQQNQGYLAVYSSRNRLYVFR